VALAKAALKGVLGSQRREEGQRVSPEAIREAVSKAWNVSSDGLSSKSRTKDLTVPRQVAMYLIRELLDLPLTRIGGLFGGRDHSTVIHSIRKAEENMAADPSFEKRVEDLKKNLAGRV
jgi:chromosomal replication initiator protein